MRIFLAYLVMFSTVFVIWNYKSGIDWLYWLSTWGNTGYSYLGTFNQHQLVVRYWGHQRNIEGYWAPDCGVM